VIDLLRLSLAIALALSAAAGSAQPAHGPVQDTMAQRMQACTVCHGREGRATADGYFPRIAGKPAGYLHNQLVNFRSGRRHNATMTYFVEHMSDAYLREIAAYFAALDLPYPAAQATGTLQALERGRRLVTQGDPQRRIPPCAQCHGASLLGAEPSMPGLLGLPHYYIAGQIGAWRTGLRQAAAPDCMAEVAKQLTDADIAAVAAWLSSQTPPPSAKPEPALREPLPMPCGSGAR
jgi:cytochrome c553